MLPWRELVRIAWEKGYAGAEDAGQSGFQGLVRIWDPWVRFLLERMARMCWGHAADFDFSVESRQGGGRASTFWALEHAVGDDDYAFYVMLDCSGQWDPPQIQFAVGSEEEVWICEPTLPALMEALETVFAEGPIKVDPQSVFRRLQEYLGGLG